MRAAGVLPFPGYAQAVGLRVPLPQIVQLTPPAFPPFPQEFNARPWDQIFLLAQLVYRRLPPAPTIVITELMPGATSAGPIPLLNASLLLMLLASPNALGLLLPAHKLLVVPVPLACSRAQDITELPIRQLAVLAPIAITMINVRPIRIPR